MKVLPAGAVTLPAATVLYRVQRPVPATGPTGLVAGAVHLPATAARRGRFDLAAVPVAAFALDADTAVYETFARATSTAISLSLLAARELLNVRTPAGIRVYDARPHAHAWPFLTAARYAAAQDEAHEADVAHGLFGVWYASAQRQGAECVALFDKTLPSGATVLRALTPVSAARLLNSAGALHRAVLGALVGSQLPLLP